MATYGTVLYGEAVYEAAPAPSGLVWSLQMDWDNDDSFEADEGERMQGLKVSRGRDYVIRKSGAVGAGIEPVRIGEMTVYLENEDGRYDVYNSGSALYPNVRPGRKLSLTVQYDGVTYPIFAGKIADIDDVDTEPRQVMIRAVDGMELLGEGKVSIALATNRRIDEAIGDVLDAADWPSGWGRLLDSTPDYLPYWWAYTANARELLRDLADASLGQFYIAADGQAVFRSRYRSDSAVVSLEQSDVGKDIAIRRPWDVVYNRITVTSRPRSVQATGELWKLMDRPYIAAGGNQTVWARYVYEGQYVPAVAATVTLGDFSANSSQDGSGSDLTSNFSITIVKASEAAKVTFSNIGGTGAYITLATLDGDAVAALSETESVAEDTDSQAANGLRDLTIEENNWFQDTNNASEFVKYLASLLADPSEYPHISIQKRPTLQFAADLFYLIVLDAPARYIDSRQYRVGQIEHTWLHDNGQEVLTRIRLEPYTAAMQAWAFPAQIGINTVFGF